MECILGTTASTDCSHLEMERSLGSPSHHIASYWVLFCVKFEQRNLRRGGCKPESQQENPTARPDSSPSAARLFLHGKGNGRFWDWLQPFGSYIPHEQILSRSCSSRAQGANGERPFAIARDLSLYGQIKCQTTQAKRSQIEAWSRKGSRMRTTALEVLYKLISARNNATIPLYGLPDTRDGDHLKYRYHIPSSYNT